MNEEAQPFRHKDFYLRRIALFAIIMVICAGVSLLFGVLTMLSDPGIVKWLAYSFDALFTVLAYIAIIMVIRYTLPIIKQIKERKKEQQST